MTVADQWQEAAEEALANLNDLEDTVAAEVIANWISENGYNISVIQERSEAIDAEEKD